MITTARTAQADQLHAEVRDARGYDGHAETCDALDPCAGCQAKTVEVRVARRAARRVASLVPPPRTALDARLRAARLV